MKLIENCKKIKAAGIVLKKMKRLQGLDGWVWSCDVHLAGVKLGGVFDDGNGGCLSVEMSATDQSKLVGALKGVDYPLGLTFEGEDFVEPATDFGYIEWVLPAIADELESLKKLQRTAKTKTLYQLHDDKEGEHWVIRQVYSAALVAALQQKHGSNLKEVLNETIAAL